jgi:homogentisate 1,2-dioxygenase
LASCCCTSENIQSCLCALFWLHTITDNATPIQAWTGPYDSRRLRLPDFQTIGTWRWHGCQPYVLAAFTPRRYSWYSFLLEVESTPGP